MYDVQLYCRVDEEEIVEGPTVPPRVHDGIKNFDRQPNNVLSQYGWLPVNKPILGEDEAYGDLVLMDGWVDQLVIKV